MTVDVSRLTNHAPQLQALPARLMDWLANLIFPPMCGHCRRVDYRFCHDCQNILRSLPITLAYRQVTHLDAVCAAGKHKGILQTALQSLKYEDAVELAPQLAAMLSGALRQVDWEFGCIAPVPLHEHRLQERGYNQAQLLSRHIETSRKVAVRDDLLARTRDTSQQARLSEAERRINVKDAFIASDATAGMSILLVDDVVTTGSTLSECAAALRAKGAAAVYALAVSHA